MKAVYSCLFHLWVVPTGGSSKRLFAFLSLGVSGHLWHFGKPRQSEQTFFLSVICPTSPRKGLRTPHDSKSST